LRLKLVDSVISAPGAHQFAGMSGAGVKYGIMKRHCFRFFMMPSYCGSGRARQQL
jgi:hypothetical protein